MASDLTFTVHIANTVAAANILFGWALEHRIKEENHKRIMGNDNKVLKRISEKGKRMFDLLHKSGDK